VQEEQQTVQTADGPMATWVFRGDKAGPVPAVIVFMDAGGVRESMKIIARRIAGEGYLVLLPDLYHRQGPVAPFDFKTVFTNEPELARLMGLVRSMNPRHVATDVRGLLALLDGRADVREKQIGVTGYCMGAGLAIHAAAAFPDSIRAVAAYHGARMHTDAPESPHQVLDKIRARLYIAPAGIDPHFPPEELERLKGALKAAGTNHVVEVYEGVRHGYAVSDHPAYDPPAAERHMDKLLALFRETL
jgi:carboxymethylenebutenolidase